MSFWLRVAIPTFLFAVCIAIADAPCLATAVEAGYRLNPGDMIRLSVWEDESLTREAVVHPDGSVSFPLAGQVPAAGRTLADLQAEVTQRIKKYVADPVVTVELLEARGNRIYVLGEVNSPGQFQLDRPTSVAQAIALAGGFTAFASRSRIQILRHKAAGSDQELAFDFDSIAKGRDLGSNVELHAGDTIIVPGGSLF